MTRPKKQITATFVRGMPRGNNPGVEGQKLWRLSAPIRTEAMTVSESNGVRYFSDGTAYTNYVVTSAANVPFSGPETYLFPADKDGKIINWLELEGSFRGDLDHQQAIRNAGWLIAGEK